MNCIGLDLSAKGRFTMNTRIEESIGQGIYTVPDVSRFTSVPTSNIYNWLYGGSLSNKVNNISKKHPTLAHQFNLMNHIANISFNDMIQIRFVNYFRAQGVSLQSIRHAAKNAAKLLSTTHPFCSAKFKTDGVHLLAEVCEHDGKCNLVELKSMQNVFKEFIDPFLTTLDYEQEIVSRWWHDQGNNKVVLDPRYNFGKPTIPESGYTTETLFDAFKANGLSFNVVADWFEIDQESVEAAVDFEMRLAA
jgi:uncharacterized protein (DUF433 family)